MLNPPKFIILSQPLICSPFHQNATSVQDRSCLYFRCILSPKSLGPTGVRILITEAKIYTFFTWICEGECQILTSQQGENLKERPILPFPEIRHYCKHSSISLMQSIHLDASILAQLDTFSCQFRLFRLKILNLPVLERGLKESWRQNFQKGLL